MMLTKLSQLPFGRPAARFIATTLLGVCAALGQAAAADSQAAVPAPFPYRPTGRINPDGVNVLAAADADRTGEFRLRDPVTHLKTEILDWQSENQALHWTIVVPRSGDYEVTALLRVKSNDPVRLVVSSEESLSTSTFHVDPRGFQSRSVLDQPIHLAAGRHSITLAIRPDVADAAFDVEFLALELAEPSVRRALRADALAMRTDARWMGQMTLGLAFTWSKRTMPRHGPQKSYDDAVTAFDVERFADQVASTGAAFVVFSTSHSDQYIPGPNRALDSILPGRTAKRDLIADLIAALGKRHIKLFLYYHLGPVEDPAWSRATHMWDSDSTRFFDNWKSIITEMGQRYGKGLAGWWFDDGVYNYYYRSPDWAALDRAAKAGDPQRPVCFNSWNAASATEFQDYYCGEETAPGGTNDFLNHDGSFNGLLTQGGDGRFTQGQFAGLQSATMFELESDWVHTRRDSEALAPKRTPQSLAKTIELLNAYHTAPMLNLLIYQDGEIPAKSLEVVRAASIIAGVRKP